MSSGAIVTASLVEAEKPGKPVMVIAVSTNLAGSGARLAVKLDVERGVSYGRHYRNPKTLIVRRGGGQGRICNSETASGLPCSAWALTEMDVCVSHARVAEPGTEDLCPEDLELLAEYESDQYADYLRGDE